MKSILSQGLVSCIILLTGILLIKQDFIVFFIFYWQLRFSIKITSLDGYSIRLMLSPKQVRISLWKSISYVQQTVMHKM